MTWSQIETVLNGVGITKYENIRIPKLNNIIMSQNFFVVPERDLFTFDKSNELIKIKQREEIKMEDNKKEESPITTFNLESEVTSTPAWVSAVRNTQKSRNI